MTCMEAPYTSLMERASSQAPFVEEVIWDPCDKDGQSLWKTSQILKGHGLGTATNLGPYFTPLIVAQQPQGALRSGVPSQSQWGAQHHQCHCQRAMQEPPGSLRHTMLENRTGPGARVAGKSHIQGQL